MTSTNSVSGSLNISVMFRMKPHNHRNTLLPYTALFRSTSSGTIELTSVGSGCCTAYLSAPGTLINAGNINAVVGTGSAEGHTAATSATGTTTSESAELTVNAAGG